MRGGDARLLGAPVWWAFDAAVLWATFHALGEPPSLAILAFAYFAGQVGNTLPLPGAVSGGMVGTLLAFGVAPDLALSAVLSYRAVAIWLPAPMGLAALGALRGRVARWGRDDVEAADLVVAIVRPALPPRSRRPCRSPRRRARRPRTSQPRAPRRSAPRPRARLRSSPCRARARARPDRERAGMTTSAPPGSSLSLHERLPATMRSVATARQAVRRFAADLDVDVDGLVLAVSEAVANVAAYAYGDGVAGTVELDGSVTPYEVTVVVRDRGRGLGGSQAHGAGFGLEIIRRLAQHVELADSRQGVALVPSSAAALAEERARDAVGVEPALEREPRDAGLQRRAVEQSGVREPRRGRRRRARAAGPRRAGARASSAPCAAAQR